MHTQNTQKTTHSRMFVSTSDDPALNLAAEELLFSRVGPSDVFLHTYSNRRSVVTGKHQNPWKECAVSELQSAGIDIIRRISGGGTVFHDPGNLNFSFLMDRELFDKGANLSLVARALSRLGIVSEVTARGDILVDGRKVSGNALAFKKGRVMHHGTLLVDADLGGLRSSIQGWRGRIDTHAVESNPFPVANLADFVPGITLDSVRRALGEEFTGTWGGEGTAVELLDVLDPGALAERAEEYRKWEWNFGHSPAFSARLPFPNETGLTLRVDGGIVSSVTCCANVDSCVIPGLVSGSRFDSAEIGRRCRNWLEHDISTAVSGGCLSAPGMTRHELVAALAGFVESQVF